MAEPATLGRYQIERVLGKGAMGVVYEALDPKLNRKVAIKTILVSQLDEETAKDFSRRFVREAHAVARLNHPNIVQVYDFGEEGGVAYLVMEFIRGSELKSALASGRVFDRRQCVRIMSELLDALDFAHEAGVVHRDIKPANVMLDSQGRAKLTDFGVARITDADRTGAERTQAGTVVGTPAYMSPEQIEGQRVDRRSDIFSAGIILYQFLTGQKPFTGEGAWTVARKIIQEDPPMPSTLNVEVPRQYDDVVARALAKNPEGRFPTAREFAQALRRAAEGQQAIDKDAATTVVVPLRKDAQAPRPAAEMELEFWRSIKDSEDASDYELYLKQFPEGTYAPLAGRRIARLRGLPGGEDTAVLPASGAPAAGKTVKLPTSQSKARPLVWVLVAAAGLGGAAAFFAVTRPAPAPGDAAPKASSPAKDERVERDAANKAKREAETKIRREAEALAKRKAEARAKQEADARAKQEADAKAKQEADAKAKQEAEARAKQDAEAAKKKLRLTPGF
jgi:serine/threonine protein kinase